MKYTEIVSKDNPVFKVAKTLLTPRGIKKSGLFLAEGYRAVKQIISYGGQDKILVRKSDLEEFLTKIPDFDGSVYVLSNILFDSLSDTVNSQGVILISEKSTYDISKLFHLKKAVVVMADGVQDPGNLGSIIRTAVSFDAVAVLCNKGTTEPFSLKAVRSSMGGCFKIPIIETDTNFISNLKANGYTIYGSFLSSDSINYAETSYSEKSVIIMGNEGSGISNEVSALCDHKIHIPMSSKMESLNVSVACAIILSRIYQLEKK